MSQARCTTLPASNDSNAGAVNMAHNEDAPGDVEMAPAGHRDKAARLLDSAQGQVPLTAAGNRRVLRKIDLVILPILPILPAVSCLQALDKATLLSWDGGLYCVACPLPVISVV